MFLVVIIVVVILAIIGIAIGRGVNKKKRSEVIDQILATISLYFKPETVIRGVQNRYLFADDPERQQFLYVPQFQLTQANQIPAEKWHDMLLFINYEDIISVEVVENGTSIYMRSVDDVVGGALVGKAFAGRTGAIIGGLSAPVQKMDYGSLIFAKIHLRNHSLPVLEIPCYEAFSMNFNNQPAEKTDIDYQQGLADAQSIADLVIVAIDHVQNGGSPSGANVSSVGMLVADEISKLANLRDNGVLTESEFQAQKKMLLKNSRASSSTANNAQQNRPNRRRPVQTSDGLRFYWDCGKTIYLQKYLQDHKMPETEEEKFQYAVELSDLIWFIVYDLFQNPAMKQKYYQTFCWYQYKDNVPISDVPFFYHTILYDLITCNYKIGYKIAKYEIALMPLFNLYTTLEHDSKIDFNSYRAQLVGQDLPEAFIRILDYDEDPNLESDRLRFAEFLRENDQEYFPTYLSLLQGYAEFVGKEANCSSSKIDSWIRKLEEMEETIPQGPKEDEDEDLDFDDDLN